MSASLKVYLFEHTISNRQLLVYSNQSQVSKYIEIGTCPASQKIMAYMGKKINFIRNIKFSLALQPEALVNTSGRELFSSPESGWVC